MAFPTTAESDQWPGPFGPRDIDVPARLRGSRAAIFHLLREPPGQDDPAPARPALPRPAAAPAPWQAAPSGRPARAAEPPAADTLFRSFLQADQFEFVTTGAGDPDRGRLAF